MIIDNVTDNYYISSFLSFLSVFEHTTSIQLTSLFTVDIQVSRNATGKEFIDCKHFLELSADVYLSLLQPPD